ncbi:MAG: methylmalonyl Co-A mutase-associated GTPase MeaB, partial [Candidatus Tectomicrobia bacterium]|nr:methylmalonyl Co-A mutase-associated GTPase MeaB [Candidatus Tectomicrobia bacterium]
IVETVGVGQTELDIMRVADTVMVVLVPEAGDAIQTMKAGLMEIADIFVVNKADREGADAIRNDLITMLHLSPRYDWWDVPVMTTEAKDNVGIPELFGKIEKHRNVLIETGHLERRRQARRERAFTEVLYEKLKRAVEKRMADDQRYPSLKEEVISGKIDPYRAADDVLKSLFGD